MEIILGSASPRRRELLELTGHPFTVEVREVEEKITQGTFGEIAMDIARQKAKAFLDDDKPDRLVICGDTIVVANDKILGKPKDKKDAFRMLKMLSGRKHEVYSGVAILYLGQIFTFFEKTAVEFIKLKSKEIADYIETGEPLDKAGSYGIQGLGALFVRRIEGDYYNVVGLPVCQLNIHLKDILDDNCTYILRCANGSLYTGWTNDIEKRLDAHNNKSASKYTRAKGPVELVYLEKAFNKSQAMSREANIKKLRRTDKENLVIQSQIALASRYESTREILNHFNLDRVTARKLAGHCGKTQSEIESALAPLVNDGLVNHDGDGYRFNFQKNILENHLANHEEL